MTFGLYECLKAVGLHQHYARFISAGVCHAAHLSAISMEDYRHLGVCTMEERTRLYDLVQMIKNLDLDSFGYNDGGDYDDNAEDDDEGYAGAKHQPGPGNPDEDAHDDKNEAHVRPLNVRRRLDFSFENRHPQQRLVSRPEDTVQVCTSNNAKTRQAHGRASAMPRQLHQGSPVVCNCKENNDKPGVYSCSSDHHLAANMKSGEVSMFNFTDRSPSRSVSLHEPKPRSPTVSPSTANTKKLGHEKRKGLFRKQSFCSDLDRNGSTGHVGKQTPVYEAKTTAGYNYGLPLSAPASPTKRRVGDQRINVCVRKRKLIRPEKIKKETDVVTIPGGACVIVHEGKEALDLTQYILQHKFYFDCVFGEDSSNEEVYQSTAYPLVQHMLSGGSATCFAYGQTGAGKTHTMLGSSPGRPGLYALAVRDIFMHLSTTHTHSSLQVYVSFFEIYCGQLYDLLDHRKRLFAREDGLKVVHIAGLCDVKVESVNSLLEVIQRGTEVRSQGMSGVNPTSSRSHALLQIQLRNPKQQIAGRMWFVDLAGSERASDTKDPDRQSRMEGAEINQSLLALKECIRSLDKEQLHTPFRQSKLTQVLKDSFVGDSMTCMIANISPGHTATEHTLNTLRYADRVKELKGKGGLRGRGGSKTIATPKHYLSNGNSSRSSSGGTRGKSPPKKPKLGRQNEDIGLAAFAMKLLQEDPILCSTPKNSRCSEEAKAMDRRGIRLQNISPLRSSIGRSDKKHVSKGSGATKSRRVDSVRGVCAGSCSVNEKSVRSEPMCELPVDEQLISCVEQKERVPHADHFSFTKRESGLNHKEKVKQKCNMKGASGEDQKWIELRKLVETSGDATCTAERNSDSSFPKADEEKKMHLRRYHKQLQQFIPLSSSFHLFPPSTPSSVPSSVASSPMGVEGLDASDGPGDEMWRAEQEEAAHSFSPVSVHSSSSLFSPPDLESPTQTAPAERPLSPHHEPTNTFLTSEELGDTSLESKRIGCKANFLRLLLCNSTATVPSHHRREKKGCFTTNVSDKELSCETTSPVSTPITHSDFAKPPHKLFENTPPTKNAKTSDSPQVNAESPNCIMDPLSISLLQVDQQAATASFLQRGNSYDSSSRLEDESRDRIKEVEDYGLTRAEMKGEDCEYKDGEFHLSFLELPEIKPHVPTRSDSATATIQAERSHIGHQSAKPGSPSFHNRMTNARQAAAGSAHYNLKNPPASMTTPSAQRFSGQVNTVPSKCHSNNSSHSSILLQPSNTTGLKAQDNTSNQQMRPTLDLFTLDELDHAKWSVIEAHWEQLKEMEALCRKEGMLLSQQPDMAFGEYVHKLEEIMEGKAECVHGMRALLQRYLKSIRSHEHGEHNHNPLTK